jgi:molybdopterin molybdotransferase
MISVDEAQARLLDLVNPLGSETVALSAAAGRVLAQTVTATRDQPPFRAAAMDGYAVKAVEVERHAMFKVIGEAAAGHGFDGSLGPGQAVRIFTGAPVPQGADFIVIQEDTGRSGDLMTILEHPGEAAHIRPAGVDFAAGTPFDAPRRLGPQEVALLAAMNVDPVPVVRRPVVALLSTGDELVMPGQTPGPDQITVSNTFGLAALLADLGAAPRVLPVARDTEASLRTAFDLAAGADLVITIGGASVGDHDLVGEVAEAMGMDRAFYKVAMRPGKPLMAGRIGETAMVGLPGNPVSAMVCGHVFVAPMIRRMLGLDPVLPSLRQARLGEALSANGPRAHYMRARLAHDTVTAFDRQDSSLLSVLASANALLVRPPDDPARSAGAVVNYLPL